MKQSLKNKILFWMPRILGIVCILFLGVFALDAFTPGRPLSEQLIAFFIHLLPNYVLLIVLLVAWKNELYGGILYVVFGILGTIFFETYTFLPTFLLISFPVFLIGGLFLWHYFLEKNNQ